MLQQLQLKLYLHWLLKRITTMKEIHKYLYLIANRVRLDQTTDCVIGDPSRIDVAASLVALTPQENFRPKLNYMKANGNSTAKITKKTKTKTTKRRRRRRRDFQITKISQVS